MRIIHKTLVTNLLKQTMNFTFFDKHGVHFGPGEQKILDGIYPTACRNEACVRDLEAALMNNQLSLSVVTNLPCMEAPSEAALPTVQTVLPKQKQERDIVKEDNIKINRVEGGVHERVVNTTDAEKEETRKSVKVDVSDGDGTVSGRWQRKSHGATQETKPLFGEDSEMQKPEVKPMFPDDKNILTHPELYDKDAREASVRDTLAKADAADQALREKATATTKTAQDQSPSSEKSKSTTDGPAEETTAKATQKPKTAKARGGSRKRASKEPAQSEK